MMSLGHKELNVHLSNDNAISVIKVLHTLIAIDVSYILSLEFNIMVAEKNI